jgi:CBS domain-containing protein
MRSTANLLQNLPSLASIVDRQPLTVDPQLPLVEVIALMSQAKGRNCLLPDVDRSPELEISTPAHHSSSVLVLADERLVGIFTDRDLVRFTASQRDLQGIKVADVMTTELQTLVLSEQHTVMSALTIFQQHQIRDLPILDEGDRLIGIVTKSQLLQSLDPLEMLYMLEQLQAEMLQRSAELEQSNRELRLEVNRRQQVEDDLERRAIESTTELALRTQQLQTEVERHQLQKSALDRFNQALSQAMEGIALIDLQGHYVQIDRAYAQTLGYSPEAMVGMDWQRTVHPEDLENMQLAYQHMQAHGKVEVTAKQSV